jgi:hypothetical protein
MAERSELEVGFPPQVRYSTCLVPAFVLNHGHIHRRPQSLSNSSPSRTFEEGKRSSGAARAHGTVSFVTTADFATATRETSDPSSNGRNAEDGNSELEGEESAGKPGPGYDLHV